MEYKTILEASKHVEYCPFCKNKLKDIPKYLPLYNTIFYQEKNISQKIVDISNNNILNPTEELNNYIGNNFSNGILYNMDTDDIARIDISCNCGNYAFEIRLNFIGKKIENTKITYESIFRRCNNKENDYKIVNFYIDDITVLYKLNYTSTFVSYGFEFMISVPLLANNLSDPDKIFNKLNVLQTFA